MDLQLHMYITTDVVSSNLDQDEVHNICRRFFLGPPVSSTNKTEILLKVALEHRKTKPSINYRRLPTKYIWFSNSIYDYIRMY